MTPNVTESAETRIREGFPEQRLVVLPANAIERSRILPLVSQLHITHIGSFLTAPHHYVERKDGAPQAILIYCLTGSGSLYLGDDHYTIKPGHVAIIPPHTPHIYHADDKYPWSIFWIHFSGHQIREVLTSFDIDRSGPRLYVPDTHLMRDAFENIYASLNYYFSDAGLLSMTSELMVLFSKIKLHQAHIEPQKQSAQNRMMETLQFMGRHLNMPLTLKDLATHANQSVPYYSKLFKAHHNQSPMTYFIQLKIRKACELLDQTEMNIQEVAHKIGYEDAYYFSRLFKKVQGTSPTSYRENLRKLFKA
ncbi:AraC family transcriptional regulator [Luteolibacter algae]